MQAFLKASDLKPIAQHLADVDPALADVLKELGPPPLWKRSANFSTLIRILLEQQVSLSSAAATYKRLSTACKGRVTAARIGELGSDALRELGFTRQKARYAVALAADVTSGRLVVGRLRDLPDDEVMAQITRCLGFGVWSAQVFLLLALTRPDVLPVGDLALVKGLHELDGGEYGSVDALISRTELWRPYRGVATRMVWQFYLTNRNRIGEMSG